MNIINGWIDCWKGLRNWWQLLTSPFDKYDQAAFFFYLAVSLSGAYLQPTPWDDYLYYGAISDVAWSLDHDSPAD